MSTSSIDDLLLGAKTQHHPETPENQHVEEPEEVEEVESDEPESENDSDDSSEEPKDDHTDDEEDIQDEDEKPKDNHTKEYDEYGNEKERMSKGMKERLDRKERQHQREIEQREAEINQLRSQLANQGASREVQQAARDFEYDPEAKGDWQQQLAQFVKQTVAHMNYEETERQRQKAEEATSREFQQKFTQGMNRFEDFREVVGSMPMDDAMTLALRGMDDPTAFLYAASKRQPQEIERISKLRDPYARMVEMGKLEERMRRNKPTTKAPRPLGRTQEDASAPVAKKKSEPSIEELIAKADAKKLARIKGRKGGVR